MKAMLLTHNGYIDTNPLHLTEVSRPRPGPYDLVLKVRSCAICRTDLHVIEGDLPAKTLPIIPGHQVVGIVEEIGDKCKRFGLGARVGVAWLRATCGQCSFCIFGKENLCTQARFTGYHSHGGFAEYALIHEEYAYEIPAVFGDCEATPLLCAGIIGYRALKRADLPAGGRLGIYGFGSSAHIVIQLARHRGSDVYVSTREPGHQALAEQMGAAWVGGLNERPPAKLESAIIFAPASDLVPAALEALDRGGTLSLAGIHMSNIPSLQYEKHLFYEKNLHSVTANTRSDGLELLREAAKIPIYPHITRFPLEDANAALISLKNDSIRGTGVLVVKK